jgi:NADPH:quinone reductase-like Zn-dependent oxidoreductase
VGHLAVQLAARRAAYVIGTTSSSAGADMVRSVRAKPAIDSVFPLEEFRAAFERSMASGKRGKVVLRVIG